MLISNDRIFSWVFTPADSLSTFSETAYVPFFKYLNLLENYLFSKIAVMNASEFVAQLLPFSVAIA
jgi:hypothetical protein